MVIIELEPAQSLARRIGMQRSHGTVVTGVHCLQQVERLRSAHFADDDPFRPHAQTVLDKIAHRDRAASFKVWRPRFKPDDMRLLQLQLRGIFAGDHPFVVIDVIGDAVEERRLAGSRAARNQNIAAHSSDDFKNFAPLWGNGTEPHKLIESQLVFAEFADREDRPIDRQRRRNDVDARAVDETRVANWRGFIDPASDLTDDALTDIHQLRIVAKPNVGQLNLAANFDERPGRAVHHNVGDVVASEQRFEGTVAKDIIADIVDKILLFANRKSNILDRDDFMNDVANFLAGVVRVEARQLREIDRLDEGAEDHAFGDIIIARPLRFES